MHPDQNDLVTKTWLEAVSQGADFNMEILLKRHDGVYRWHSSHALPIKDQDGKITSWVCSCSDIHDRKMFAEELERQINERTQSLKESNNALEHSNKNLEQFAFIASHDLQEPLRKIQTFSNILNENFLADLSEEGQKLVKKIQSAAGRLSLLIQDVLNFSRIQFKEHAFRTTDLNLVLDNVLGDFSLLIEEKNASVKAGNLPTIEAIPVQVNQLFYNLISNALKFSTTAGIPAITITSRKLAKVEVLKFASLNSNLDYFDLQFADNGIGFDPIHKEKIFQIFQRLHKQDEYSGTGIGLALCRKIVDNHKGLLFADSQPGAGSLFHIILPLNEHHPAIDLLPGYAE
jgi:two-component system, chemotaxis family, CheB/CheR fusion protein